MGEMNERELLSAILKAVETSNAKTDSLADELLHFRKDMNEFKTDMYEFKKDMYEFKKDMYEFKTDMYEFKKDMNEFRRETVNSLNKVERRLRFVETDFDQINDRVDKLELRGGTSH
ncbi:hypothetical protein [Paenibacillus whitsoniae]|uniref:Uncharacterized protein n=1 Tax=Paenibacillus whitsoniae TaxID=2496558 RepID=A0A3S0BI93_9BACL|nr:hypothetical protein [Paenibacillus whitsoniae]RTE05776.1 hypothetical protein EJQ19_23895 [Paenibacillus whitsoniae]